MTTEVVLLLLTGSLFTGVYFAMAYISYKFKRKKEVRYIDVAIILFGTTFMLYNTLTMYIN